MGLFWFDFVRFWIWFGVFLVFVFFLNITIKEQKFYMVIFLGLFLFLNPGAETTAININLSLIIWLFSISLDYVDFVI